MQKVTVEAYDNSFQKGEKSVITTVCYGKNVG